MKCPKCLTNIIDFEHCFTPFAIERLVHLGRNVKLVYIFGIRVAYFNIGNK